MKTQADPVTKGAPRKLIALWLPEPLHDLLMAEAKRKDSDKSKVIREALRRRLGV